MGVFRSIRQKLEKSIQALRNLKVGETYVINPDYPLAKEYEGFRGDTFQFLDQEDERLMPYKNLIERSSQVLFVGRHKRIFVIDFRAVCLPSEIKKPTEEDEDYDD